jgi:hypothetical protein
VAVFAVAQVAAVAVLDDHIHQRRAAQGFDQALTVLGISAACQVIALPESAQYWLGGKATVRPSSSSLRVTWQLSRLPGWRGEAVNSSMLTSSGVAGGKRSAHGG